MGEKFFFFFFKGVLGVLIVDLVVFGQTGSFWGMRRLSVHWGTAVLTHRPWFSGSTLFPVNYAEVSNLLNHVAGDRKCTCSR